VGAVDQRAVVAFDHPHRRAGLLEEQSAGGDGLGDPSLDLDDPAKGTGRV
jgi:hypothetical protein